MASSWSATLWLRAVLLVVLGGGIVAGVWLVTAGLAQDREWGERAGAQERTSAPMAFGVPALPRSGALSQPITLDEARLIVERSGKGEIIKADVTGEGAKTLFTIAVRGKDGSQTVYMDGSGTVLIENPERPRGKKGASPSKKRQRERRDRDMERRDN